MAAYTQSVFTQATLNVMDDVNGLKSQAKKTKAPTFLHEKDVPSPVRKKRLADMTEFERMMESQNG